MNEIAIDKLNIVLLFVSLIIAIFIPFELFLFSYAVLGPIHYVTEINWLHQKKYFVNTNSKWMWVFVLFTLISTLLLLLRYTNFYSMHIEIFKWSTLNFRIFILTGFFFSISFLFFKDKKSLILSFLGSLILSLFLLKFVTSLFFMVGAFLPTLIHVYVFTFFFMLYGALKKPNKYGMLTLIIIVLIPLLIWNLPLDSINYHLSNKTLETYVGTNFNSINKTLSQLISSSKFSLTSTISVKIQIFIAFAYTYHYLNWFSKTNIIGWQKNLSKQKVGMLLFIWISAVCLYFYNYKTGLIALFFLSALHVFLEFPLNIISIKESFLIIRKKLLRN